MCWWNSVYVSYWVFFCSPVKKKIFHFNNKMYLKDWTSNVASGQFCFRTTGFCCTRILRSWKWETEEWIKKCRLMLPKGSADFYCWMLNPFWQETQKKKVQTKWLPEFPLQICCNTQCVHTHNLVTPQKSQESAIKHSHLSLRTHTHLSCAEW